MSAQFLTLSLSVKRFYSYEETVTLPIQVANTGKVVAQFRLVPKLDEVSSRFIGGSSWASFSCAHMPLSPEYSVQALDESLSNIRNADSR